MSNRNEASAPSSFRLILIPSAIALAVTLLRLAGELRHWPTKWFSPETGGIIPSGVTWVFGITWLSAIFGVYFALELARSGRGPRTLLKPALCAILRLSKMPRRHEADRIDLTGLS